MFAKWLSGSGESESVNMGEKGKKTWVVSGIEGLELGGGKGQKKKGEEAMGGCRRGSGWKGKKAKGETRQWQKAPRGLPERF